jgi:hypothetical protein
MGAIAGFFAWVLLWVGGERLVSAVGPDWFGPQQLAFQAAIEHGGAFTADTRLLLVHLILGSIVSLLSGFVAALVAGENRRAPMVLGVLLVALGVLKAVLSWPYVPLWYHAGFTALLMPMAMLGAALYSSKRLVASRSRS